MSDDITKLNIYKVSADAFDGLERVIEQYPEGEEPSWFPCGNTENS